MHARYSRLHTNQVQPFIKQIAKFQNQSSNWISCRTFCVDHVLACSNLTSEGGKKWKCKEFVFVVVKSFQMIRWSPNLIGRSFLMTSYYCVSEIARKKFFGIFLDIFYWLASRGGGKVPALDWPVWPSRWMKMYEFFCIIMSTTKFHANFREIFLEKNVFLRKFYPWINLR